MCTSKLILILLTIVIGGSVAAVDMLPVTLSPVNNTESRSCQSAASVTEIKAKILGSLYKLKLILT